MRRPLVFTWPQVLALALLPPLALIVALLSAGELLLGQRDRRQGVGLTD